MSRFIVMVLKGTCVRLCKTYPWGEAQLVEFYWSCLACERDGGYVSETRRAIVGGKAHARGRTHRRKVEVGYATE